MADKRVWEPLTVWDNIDAGVRHLGLTEPGVVWGLAQVDWESVDERDTFLRYITRSQNA